MSTDTREALAALPPLPEPEAHFHVNDDGEWTEGGNMGMPMWTAEQMQAYARAALATQPAQPSAQGEAVSKKNKFGEWAFTTQGQPVLDNVPLRHECNGASDYCMHCGADMCKAGSGQEACPALEKARRQQIDPSTVTAFGCDAEASLGIEPCEKWCQGNDCAYTRAALATQPAQPSAQGVPKGYVKDEDC